MFLQQLANAISLGSVYALFALGFTLIFGVLGVINLSHGTVFMLGSYTGWFLVAHLRLPLALAVPAGMLASGGVGFIIDRLVLKRLRARNAPHLIPMVATIGVGIFITSVVRGTFGVENQRFPVEATPVIGLNLGDIYISLTDIVTVAITPLMGQSILDKGIAVIILGGMGDIRGAVIGGLLLGFAEVYSVAYLSSGFRDAISFGLLFLILLVRPSGIFGRPPARKD